MDFGEFTFTLINNIKSDYFLLLRVLNDYKKQDDTLYRIKSLDKVIHSYIYKQKNIIMLKNKTKIVATLGPSCNRKETILSLIKAGANVFRINFSHSYESSIRELVSIIKEINLENDLNIAILGDLQGPKIRINKMEEGTLIKKDDFLDIVSENIIGNSKVIGVNYANIHSEINKGEKILIDDGKIILQVVDTSKKNKLKTKIIQGGYLKSNKGINLPNSNISIASLSDKDIKDTLISNRVRNRLDSIIFC